MKFGYLPHPLDPSITLPLVTANIKGPARAVEVRCLIDSGADVDSFPLSVARKIGVPIEACHSELIIGIGGKATCYLCEVGISIEDYSYKTEAQFLEPSPFLINGQLVSREIPPLLGRKNTFRNFKIVFDEAHQEIGLIPYRK